MFPEFDKNAAYIWAIVGLGIALPIMLTIYTQIRLRLSLRRLERYRSIEAETTDET